MIDTTGMHRALEIRRKVAVRSDQFASKAEEFGALAAQVITGTSGRSQLTGLEAIARSTLKIADILDYIKLRTGRQKSWQDDDFGRQLLSYLQDEIKLKPNIAMQPPLNSDEQHQVILLLMREFIRQVTAHYEFARMGMGDRR